MSISKARTIQTVVTQTNMPENRSVKAQLRITKRATSLKRKKNTGFIKHLVCTISEYHTSNTLPSFSKLHFY